MDESALCVEQRAIVGRALSGGAAGGAGLVALTLLVLLSPNASRNGYDFIPISLAYGGLVGALLGAAVGAMSGILLVGARRVALEHRWFARGLAFVTSAAPFALLAALDHTDSVWPWLFFALLSGAAGALLAPWVVKGRVVRPGTR